MDVTGADGSGGSASPGRRTRIDPAVFDQLQAVLDHDSGVRDVSLPFD